MGDPLRLITVLAFFSISAFAQVPPITAITVAAVDHASATVTIASSSPFYGQLLFGTVSGTYPYSSTSTFLVPVNTYFPGVYLTSITLGGLTPATTYFVLSTARPDLNDDINICNTSGCGAVEQTFTTLAAPAVHPIPPTPPSVWTPIRPDTSGYTIIPLVSNGTTGACVAASNISQQTGWSAAVVAGDSIQTILNHVYFGVVFEVPQKLMCNVFPTVGDTLQRGYTLPSYGTDTACTAGSQDSSTCRWVVFRTHQVAISDFPPVGMRTSDALATNYGGFTAQVPNNHPRSSGNPENYTGQLFDCGNSNCNHFLFYDLTFDYLANSTLFPSNAVDPQPFGPYFRWQANGADVTTLSTTPNYMWVDQVYSPSHPYPARFYNIAEIGGNHWAVTNSTLYSDFATIGAWPGSQYGSQGGFPSASGKVVTIPGPATFQQNALSGTPCGISSGATATFNGANIGAYTGNFVAYLSCASGSAALTVDYQTATGVSMTCNGCTATSESSPNTDSSIPIASMWYFNGHFNGAGTAVIDNILNTDNQTVGPATRYTLWRPFGFFMEPGNFGFMDNNFIQAIGQTLYTDPDGPHGDQTVTHNFLSFPRTKMQNDPTWDGYGYTFRQVSEFKIGARWNYQGNIIDGAASYQNAGFPLFLVSSWYAPPPVSNGVQDFSLTNNIFRHIPSGFSCGGSGLNGPPDAQMSARVAVANNLWIDLNRYRYSNGTNGGLWSGQMQDNPGCEDLSIRNNTVGLTAGTFPGILYIGGSNVPGTEALTEGFEYKNNVVTMSQSTSGDVFWTSGGQNVPSHPAVPANANSCIGSGCPSYVDGLNAGFVRIGSTIVPNWLVSSNTVVGGQVNTCASPTAPCPTDMTPSQINSISANWPGGSNVFPIETSLAARLAAINWNPVTFRTTASLCNAGNNGANVDAINQAVGVAQNVSVNYAPTSLLFTYTAPDARACSVDTSPDGTTWTRFTDSGGATSRSLTATGLSFSTAYQYRLMCYFDQSTSQEFLSSQVTSGTIATASGTTRTLQFAYTLPSGATKASVSLQPVSGSPVVTACGASPCAISVATGVYKTTTTYQTSGSAQVGPLNVSSLTVQ